METIEFEIGCLLAQYEHKKPLSSFPTQWHNHPHAKYASHDKHVLTFPAGDTQASTCLLQYSVFL